MLRRRTSSTGAPIRPARPRIAIVTLISGPTIERRRQDSFGWLTLHRVETIRTTASIRGACRAIPTQERGARSVSSGSAFQLRRLERNLDLEPVSRSLKSGSSASPWAVVERGPDRYRLYGSGTDRMHRACAPAGASQRDTTIPAASRSHTSAVKPWSRSVDFRIFEVGVFGSSVTIRRYRGTM